SFNLAREQLTNCPPVPEIAIFPIGLRKHDQVEPVGDTRFFNRDTVRDSAAAGRGSRGACNRNAINARKISGKVVLEMRIDFQPASPPNNDRRSYEKQSSWHALRWSPVSNQEQ